ncbi:hypothetical protein [Candidatus Oscillochloris fontis]|uniref:hypothetical protein n=1 Tax=Candidatus Oscillochloris fontis TaxID=2496868 RepID=UPI001375CFA6|nr:hypothetical protein [Candidatus Oscillochloris fontis]
MRSIPNHASPGRLSIVGMPQGFGQRRPNASLQVRRWQILVIGTKLNPAGNV